MLALCMHLAAAIHGYMAVYMPTNRAIDWLRSPCGLKWAIPAALVATPAYLCAMSVCVVILERGGPGSLNALVMLFAWNGIKFMVLGVLTPFQLLGALRRDDNSALGRRGHFLRSTDCRKACRRPAAFRAGTGLTTSSTSRRRTRTPSGF